MIAVVDVCSGNLRSVERGIARAGGDVVVTRDADVVRRADKIVVPGQGAFGVFMHGLVERGLGDAVREAIASGRPFLGICLGMQVLFDASEEQGPCPGLGVVPGRVVRIVPSAPDIKVPHIGWNRVAQRRPDPMLAGVADGAHVYFDHSYHAVPDDPSLVALGSDHGIELTAAIRRDNIFACQFHPEKSQSVGLQILRNFVERA
ncbi:MAG TPA: imidazole glycerol phosphate synthase subunit HisH [Kofleriaceae bacterium]|nr:imidazole glycerol phosphate synthase subunit HisH [Kofleriaceae bacterium]